MEGLASWLVVFSVQAAVAVGAASTGARYLRLRAAGRLAYWRLVLAATLLLAVPAALRVPLPPGVAPVAIGARSAVALALPPAVGDGPGASTYLVTIWLAGAAVCLAWLGLGFVALRRLRRTVNEAVDESLCETSARGMAIHWHAGVTRPVSFGVFQPVILLPPCVRDLSTAARDAIIDHELLHVERRDWMAHVLEEIARAVLWFHPGIWWAIDRIRLHREETVDDLVARRHDRRVYMDTLVRFADQAMPAMPVSAFGGRRHLFARMRTLAASPRALSSRSRVVGVIGVLALVSLTAACALSGQQRVFTPDDEGVTQPVPIRRVQPSYSQDAMDAGIEGEVLLAAVVEPDGSIDDVRVIDSLDAEHGLDEAAIRAARAWRFEPGTRNGEPVPVEVSLQFRFTLR